MTDVLVPVFIPYARFLEVRARRLRIAAELTPPDGQPTSVAVCSVRVANDECTARAGVRILTTGAATRVQQ